ncbi:SAM-dependent methyltransferase [Catenuloplanes japonicus]|uniref:SAM-dependent methyltransferase n=1 Tax=Catenuloplanes japonicus TaxID=33876 RepID=UPI00052403F2|nr:SAM-dependent methyltransferase [Catenuloplanes japonicus]
MDKPSVARMYDYYLGGQHHTAVDREAGDRMLEAIPTLRQIAHANRAFLRRVVGHLAAAGVRQFLDIGSGIPASGNVHEVAQAVAPGSHTLYVDLDPEAVALSNTLLRGNEDAAAIQADLATPADILDHPECERLIDPAKPTALLFLSVLQFAPDEDVVPAVRTLRDALAPGSYLALTHPVAPPEDDPSAAIRTVYQPTGTRTVGARSHAQLLALFGDYVPVAPGLVPVTHWHPDGDPGEADPRAMPMVAGLARKPM